MTALVATGGGLLMAVLRFDLMFDVQADWPVGGPSAMQCVTDARSMPAMCRAGWRAVFITITCSAWRR
jgi:hypothetical protein